MKKDELLNGATPLIMSSSFGEVDIVAWALNHRELLPSQLLKHGGLLFRDFNISSPEVFEQFALACSSRRPSKNSRGHV
jgi:hypothetical protein